MVNRDPSPRPPASLAQLVDVLVGSWVAVAPSPPTDAAEVIAIYFQPLVADNTDRGSRRQADLSDPMAFLSKGANKLVLWPIRA